MMVVSDDAHQHDGGCDLSVIGLSNYDARGGSIVHKSALNR